MESPLVVTALAIYNRTKQIRRHFYKPRPVNDNGKECLVILLVIFTFLNLFEFVLFRRQNAEFVGNLSMLRAGISNVHIITTKALNA